MQGVRTDCGCITPLRMAAEDVVDRHIAEALGVSRQRAQQLLKQALRRFRRHWCMLEAIETIDLEKATEAELHNVVTICQGLLGHTEVRNK
jgi:hypothetical protein